MDKKAQSHCGCWAIDITEKRIVFYMTGLDHKQQAKRLQQKSPITLLVLGAQYISIMFNKNTQDTIGPPT